MLKIDNLHASVEDKAILKGLSLDVPAGEVHAIMGPNGAGKTTCFNLLTKFLTPTEGTIVFDGEDVTSKSPSAIARLGMIRVRTH